MEVWHLPPTRLLLARGRTLNGIHSASVMHLLFQWGCLGSPKIVSIPDPCCDPSTAELKRHMLGPVQTLYESFNRFIASGATFT
jgi:hypothetical protein